MSRERRAAIPPRPYGRGFLAEKMKGGITRRLEEVVKSLDQNQLKKALYLSETKGLEKHHQWIEEAARTCLANRDDKSVCEEAVRTARNKVQGTVSLPIDDTGLEGLEGYMTEQKLPEETKPVEVPAPVEIPSPEAGGVFLSDPEAAGGFLSKTQKTEEELYEECEECHVAVAASRFADVCAENREEAGVGCEMIGRSLENENTEPVDWLKAMVRTAEKAQGKAKEGMTAAITELTEYLERRNSPFLKALDKEVEHAERTTVPPRIEE